MTIQKLREKTGMSRPEFAELPVGAELGTGRAWMSGIPARKQKEKASHLTMQRLFWWAVRNSNP